VSFLFTFLGKRWNMAFEKSKGVCAIATGYSGGNYSYTKIDEYIAADNYTSTPDRAQDLDSYVNANGKLKRNVLKHTRSGITFSTPYMNYSEKKKFVKILMNGMKQKDCAELPEKKIRIRYYDDWTDDYAYGFFYVPDVEFPYGGTYKGVPTYQPISMEFIEY
jgi:hypothetical protein